MSARHRNVNRPFNCGESQAPSYRPQIIRARGNTPRSSCAARRARLLSAEASRTSSEQAGERVQKYCPAPRSRSFPRSLKRLTKTRRSNSPCGRSFGQVLGGQRQGVPSLARPRLILMDEPTAALGSGKPKGRIHHPGAQGARPADSHDQSQPRSGLPPVGSHLRVATRQADRRPPCEERRQERDRLHGSPASAAAKPTRRSAWGGSSPRLTVSKRSDLESVGAAVPDHVLDQGHRRAHVADRHRRYGVLGADQRWGANGEVSSASPATPSVMPR